jgi:hypothetical protein
LHDSKIKRVVSARGVARSFTLDDAGNIDAISNGVNAGLSQGFGQDALDRLTTDAGSYGTKTCTYDASGNRLTRVHGATTPTLTYNASSNRMATHAGNTVSLHSAGNTTIEAATPLRFGGDCECQNRGLH